MKQRGSIGFLFLFLCLPVFLCLNRPAQAAEKKGQYMIKVNKQQNVVNIYRKNKKGNYKPYRAFVCSTGAATPLGSFSLGAKYRWHQLMGPTYGQYCTRVYRGILFHSVWYYKPSKNTQSYIQYNRLGTTASHGCIRLTVAASKWIYENCPSGTRVLIYNSGNPGPFGKPKARKMSGYMGWDPTDPDPGNPYFVKVTSFKISAKKKTLTLGAKKSEAKFRLQVKKFKPKKAMIKKVKYTSTNPKIASVSQKGMVKAKKAGNCRILVEAADGSSVRRICKIQVKKSKTKPKSKVAPVPVATPVPMLTPVPEPEITASPVPER